MAPQQVIDASEVQVGQVVRFHRPGNRNRTTLKVRTVKTDGHGFVVLGGYRFDARTGCTYGNEPLYCTPRLATAPLTGRPVEVLR